ncbi:sodium:solute symporter family protein [Oceanidesulfovibrio marinus]|uniref:Sodium:solute symporter family protein n=1 Tax=Oceanidesulfovibrio marinus TaxID=370038 RepID=A0A6P1ZJE0_9BACT|nr:sodium:solute symporter family protein [Oceanidesulfovibrio marinus]TVM33309.1 sodium:solute symporter family protein [Oceanidesulfovibrio marinus]
MTLLLLYCLVFIGMGVYEYARRKNFEEFAVAGRRYGGAVISISIVASCIGASATIGMTGLAYSVGTPAFWWLGSGGVGLLILGVFLAKKVRSSGAYTLPDMAEKYISPSARRLMALIIIPAWSSILAAQFIAAAKTSASLSGMEFQTALFVCALFIIGYTVLGGQNSILKSDAVQFAMVIVGLLLALYFTKSASSVSLSSIPLQFTNDAFPLSKWSYFMLVIGGSYVVCPMLFGRLLSARNEVHARRGTFFAVFGIILSAVVIVCIGLYARGLAPAGADADSILTQVVPSVMPEWAGTLLLFALLSAIISSADSCLITAATVFEHDLLGGENVTRCRLLMAAIGIMALAIAYSGSSILTLLLAANDIYVCGVVAPMGVAILAHGKRSLSTRTMLAAIFLGGLCGLLAATTGLKFFSYIGGALSLAISLLALMKSHTQYNSEALGTAWQ